ncbi:hypothetical protein D0Z00_004360 [Geotrichum galactomycetum]|uniref:Uncharacterized protein n=1 Tax=Geotrichum galactomycetum TaxID=27317 RepID=A0ACB6UYL7_9ASCO|nr:hypothetical protein D0Z00_004360 [Geotrichum candidum]
MPPATPLPYITSYPDASIRQDILNTAGPELWDNLVTTWISLVQYYLRLPATNTMSPSMRAFVESYVTASAAAGPDLANLTESELHLRASVFSLITKKDDGDGLGGKYIIVDGIAVTGIWGFVQTFGRTNTTEVQQVVRHLYGSRGGKTFINLLMDVVLADPALPSNNNPDANARLVEALCIVLLSGPAVARDWITVKWFASLQKLYLDATGDGAKVSLLRAASASFCVPPLAVLDSNVRIRVLSDVISKATSAPDSHSQLLSALLNYTNFTALIGVPSLTMSLETAKLRIPLVPSPLKHEKKQSKSRRKGKAMSRSLVETTASALPDDNVPEEAVSMLLDLFPQLSVPAVSDVIRNHGGNAELATSFLLENPDELAKYENFTVPAPVSTPKRDKGKSIAPLQPSSSSAGSSSKNNSNNTNTKQRSIYDNDDLSNLKIDTSKLIFGKKDKLSLNKLGKAYKDDKSLQATLERIYQADEDEHDDTYDDAEVLHTTVVPTLSDETDVMIAADAIRQSRKSAPASVAGSSMTDSTNSPGGSPTPTEPAPLSEAEALEAYLLDYYGSHKEEFSKSARRTRARAEIRKRTNWTDEQIEGWARMLERDPARKTRLENRYMLANSAPRNQGLLKSTAWRQPKVNSDGEQEEEEEAEGSRSHNNSNNRRRQQNRPPLDPKVQAQRKDRNKARQGNHNRKAGHAKKMERAGGPSA